MSLANVSESACVRIVCGCGGGNTWELLVCLPVGYCAHLGMFYVYACLCKWICVCVHVHMYVHVDMCVCACVCACGYVCVCMCAYACIYFMYGIAFDVCTRIFY